MPGVFAASLQSSIVVAISLKQSMHVHHCMYFSKKEPPLDPPLAPAPPLDPPLI